MDYETTKNEAKGEIPYIQHNGKKYRYVDYNTDTDTHYYRYKPLKQPDKKALAKLPTLEEARELYNIELEETAPTPAQYFMRKINEPSNDNILRTITDSILMSYLKQHKEECPEVILKLNELVKTHPEKKVREASLQTLIAIGESNTDSLTHYISNYTSPTKENASSMENKRTQQFLDKLSDQSDCLLFTLRGHDIKQYLLIYQHSCPELVKRITEILKTSRKQKVRKAAYRVLAYANIPGLKKLQCYTQKILLGKKQAKKKDKKSPSPRKYTTKTYNAPIGEFGFCCEEEKMAICFSFIKKKNWDNYEMFKKTFSSYYRYDASLQTEESIRALYDKYYQYAMNGKFEEIQKARKKRINSELPKEIIETLDSFGLRVTRADGRGTANVAKKCRRKKQYDKSRLSGFRIIPKKNGTVIAGKKFELYEEDVEDFCRKLVDGEIVIKI